MLSCSKRLLSQILDLWSIAMGKDRSQSKSIKFSDEEFISLLHKHCTNVTALQAITFANTSRKRADEAYYISSQKLTDFQAELNQESVIDELLNDIENHHDFIEAQKNALLKSPLTRYFESNVNISSLTLFEEARAEEPTHSNSEEVEEPSTLDSLSIESESQSVEDSSQSDTESRFSDSDSDEEIEATDEEIEATDEEIEATDEEIEATDEEIEATDEEIEATDEEIEATDEENEIDGNNNPDEVLSSEEVYLDSTLRQWKNAYSRAIGRSHIKNDTPCQDAVISVIQPRPAIFVADGAGSASNSHFGSQEVISQLHLAINSERMETIQKKLLDEEEFVESENSRSYAQGFINTAIASLKKLSKEEGFLISSLKCTLLVVITGHHRLFWLKVGDGFIVVENDNNLRLIGPTGKGEFANTTSFVSEKLSIKDIYYGFIPSQDITGIAAFTDGVAEKLVSTNEEKIAGAVSRFLHEIREGELTNSELSNFLEDPIIWAPPYGHDDRGLALLSRET